MSETRKKPLLFEEFSNLEGSIPWIKLVPSATPVKELRNIEEKLKINSLWMKCDDISSPLYGGNKSRKMEFIYAEALEQDKKRVLTAGAIGSNQCVANAIFCKKFRLTPMAVMIDQPVTKFVRHNLLIDLYYNTEFYYLKEAIPKSDDIYIMAPGCSTPFGNLGYIDAALELKNQVENGEIPEPDYIFVPTASSGTAAGLTIGVQLAGLKTHIHAIQTSFSSLSNLKAIQRLSKKTKKFMESYDISLPKLSFDHLKYTEEHYGGEYGLPTPECVAAINLLREQEKIILEPTYSGKTLAALLSFIRNNRSKVKDKTIVFWNTFNSHDFSDVIESVNYRDLPQELHWVFEKPIPDYGL
ncbi:MAG: pyridoxal-phosphate dependent enzyme [Candidatus Lokiarchaeota archaeon]|nr:pyridoxal-phosphate dependent enzyme [Candidatus Lokiarchaeota archaeon]MBD3337820.1 pyridoxal-phosphate dependent enzyme [Candidatus Lokiarchaeota archaeon]